MRSDCPPLLKACHDILNKAYHFSNTDCDASHTNNLNHNKTKRIPHDLAQLLEPDDHRHVTLLTRIEARSGIYSVQDAPGLGNSFICLRMPGELGWRTGRIQYILEQGDGNIQFAIRQSVNLDLPGLDPFKDWWLGGFEAKLVSTSFLDLTLVDQASIIGHAARWNLWDGMCVCVNMSQVSKNCLQFKIKYDRPLSFRSRPCTPILY